MIYFFPRPGFGGRKCDQCEENFWGNPKIECIPCNCNTLGVDPDRTQCDHSTGECFCLEGKGKFPSLYYFQNHIYIPYRRLFIYSVACTIHNSALNSFYIKKD